MNHDEEKYEYAPRELDFEDRHIVEGGPLAEVYSYPEPPFEFSGDRVIRPVQRLDASGNLIDASGNRIDDRGRRIQGQVYINQTYESGWDSKLFLGNIDDFKCSICWDVYRDASSLSCGHTFCYGCIHNETRCAICREHNRDIVPDYNKRMLVMGLQVRCSNEKCHVTGSLRSLKDHALYCIYRPVECVNCKQKVICRDFEDHKKKQCEHRNVSCDVCNHSYRRTDLHLCPLDSMNCETCEWKGNRKEKEGHDKVCPNQIVSCPLVKYGCIHTGERRTMLEHVEKTDHLLLVCKSMEERFRQLGMGL